MEALVFEVFGSLGHFRKFYTTSSALTYPFPPPTVLRGLVGAIIGLEKRVYLRHTKDLKFAVQILSPVKTLTISVNFINTKGKGGGFEPSLKAQSKAEDSARTQVIQQLVKDPRYRVFVLGNGDVFEKLREHLELRKFFYTPVLGTSEHIAEIEYVGTFEVKELEDVEGKCYSVCPLELLEDLSIASIRIGKELIPYRMEEDRTASYTEVLYPKEPNTAIEGKFKKLWFVGMPGGEVGICFMPHE
ncbi:MAG: type I-B CRISPR-associated protein Cas5 [Thermocrinis sp.]|nr:type I-B CRISPR-associated protein Cas5 [Thermocrinis sp.]